MSIKYLKKACFGELPSIVVIILFLYNKELRLLGLISMLFTIGQIRTGYNWLIKNDNKD